MITGSKTTPMKLGVVFFFYSIYVPLYTAGRKISAKLIHFPLTKRGFWDTNILVII